MKKKTLIIVIISIALVIITVGVILALSNNKAGSTNEVSPRNEKKEKEKKEQTLPTTYEKADLYDILADWAMELYESNNYNKCVKQSDNSCFLSLESLEKDYGKDITKFKDEKRGACLLDTSGISFYANNKESAFSFTLEGCEFLDFTDEPEPSELE